MSRARQLQSLFMTMQIQMLTKEDLVKALREIFEVELDEPDHALVIILKHLCDLREEADSVNTKLQDISSSIQKLRLTI